MTFSDPLTKMLETIDWRLLVPIVQVIVVFFVVLWIKSYIISLHAWLSFKSSLNICLGTWVRINTPTGHMDGQIKYANRSVIVVETKELSIFIPTKTFRGRDWILLKKAALLPEEGTNDVRPE